jgi:ankyrin repeat protein
LLGCNLSIRNHSGDTPLHTAAWKNNVEICKLLVEHGADRSLLNNRGFTPLDLARDIQVKAFVAPFEETSDDTLERSDEEDNEDEEL